MMTPMGKQIHKYYERDVICFFIYDRVYDNCDAIDLERTVLRELANTGKLFVYMNKGFWSQFKTAG